MLYKTDEITLANKIKLNFWKSLTFDLFQPFLKRQYSIRYWRFHLDPWLLEQYYSGQLKRPLLLGHCWGLWASCPCFSRHPDCSSCFLLERPYSGRLEYFELQTNPDWTKHSDRWVYLIDSYCFLKHLQNLTSHRFQSEK